MGQSCCTTEGCGVVEESQAGTAPPTDEFVEVLAGACQAELLGKRRRFASIDSLASSVSSIGNSLEVGAEHFPMHTLPMECFMELEAMEPFGNLFVQGVVRKTPKDSVVHFISHEWLGLANPDPKGVQLRRMQDVFRTAMQGCVADLFEPVDWKAFSEKVSASSTGRFRDSEASMRTVTGTLTEEDFSHHVAKGEVWLDYASIPQALDFEDPFDHDALQPFAVRSIPAYLERSDYFWVLTPTAWHVNKGTWCNFTTWRSRGWCRLEEWGNFLSTNSCAPLIVTNAPKLSTIGTLDFMMASQGKPSMAPCNGSFSCCRMGHERLLPSGERHAMPCDKGFVFPVLRKLFYSKKRQLLSQPGAKALLAGLVTLVEPIVFAGSDDAPQQDFEDETIRQFLGRFGMESVKEVVPPGCTAWEFACVLGHVPMLRKLRADPDSMAIFPYPQSHREGMDVVACCAMQGHVKALQELIDLGLITDADIDLPSGAFGITPVDRAAKYGFPDMVRFLLGMRASVDRRRKGGVTLLHGAAQAGHAHCCTVLLEHRADVNALDELGRTALHLAADPLTFYGAGEGKVEALEVLLRHGADPNLRDAANRTAYEVASAALFHEGKNVLLVSEQV